MYDQPIRFYTEYLTFKTIKRREYLNITPQVEDGLRNGGIQEGLILVPGMHIAAGVWANDAEDGLIGDIDEWLEDLAPCRRRATTVYCSLLRCSQATQAKASRLTPLFA